MARPIAYNTSHPLSGSITQTQGGGIISYTIDGGDRDYSSFAGKKWVPSADGAAPIIFVTDSFTQGISTEANSVPLFYACAGTSSAAILYTANRLPGSPGNYATVNDAITDLLSNDWFIIEGEQPYEGDYADQMVADLDASKFISYPRTQTAWYDISGNNSGATLANGPSFNGKGYLEFDGTNDYALLNGIAPTAIDGGTEASLNMWVRLQSTGNGVGTSGIIQLSGYNNNNGSLYWYSNNYTYLDIFRTSRVEQVWNNSIIDPRNWHMLTITTTPGPNGWKAYLNGELRHQVDGEATVSVKNIQGGYTIGRNSSARYLWGELKGTQIYKKALSEAEIKQNYFGSNISTNGLKLALDANNIISYPKSGTSMYDLTGSNDNTLYNGVGFDQDKGGILVFDGLNDYTQGTAPLPAGQDYYTIEAWWKAENNTSTQVIWEQGADPLASNRRGSMLLISSGYWGFNGQANDAHDKVPYEPGIWYHAVITVDATTNTNPIKLYQNGTLYWQGNTSNNATNLNLGNSYSRMGRKVATSTEWFQGDIGLVRVYDRILPPEEVQQNYQATKYRFEGIQGLIENGLVVHLDATNLESYPGTGNTWYDLSGNGNNATKNGATGNPIWDQANGWTFYASVNGVNGGLTIANSATIQNLTATTVFLVVAMETKSVIGGDSDWMAIYSKFASDQRIAISVNQVARYLHIETPAGTNSATIFNNADYTGTKFNIMAARVGASGTTGWVNGTQVSTSAATTTGNTGPIYLGHDVNNEMFKGSMKATLTYNRALSDDEMVQMFDYLNKKFSVY